MNKNSMKAYVLEGINQLEYKEIDKPVLKSGEVLVEVQAAGICGSDIPRIFTTGTYHFPTIPGHEFAGKVEKAFDESGAAWIGKRVGVFPLIPCQKCASCQEKSYEMCSNYNYLGSRCDGGFAEYVAVPVWNLIELPENVSYQAAAMLEPAAVALHAVRRLDLTKVNTVVLFGLGTIGIIITQWLRIFGVKTVIATGHSEKHGELMKKTACSDYIYADMKELECKQFIEGVQEQGAKMNCECPPSSTIKLEVASKSKMNFAQWIGGKLEMLDEKQAFYGVDAVLDCVASSQSLADAFSCVKPGGQIVVVGNPKGDISLDKNTYWQLLRKQVRLTGTWNSSFTHMENDDWNMVLQECAKGNLRLEELITHKLAFDELQKGLYIMKDKTEYRNKVMICK